MHSAKPEHFGTYTRKSPTYYNRLLPCLPSSELACWELGEQLAVQLLLHQVLAIQPAELEQGQDQQDQTTGGKGAQEDRRAGAFAQSRTPG